MRQTLLVLFICLLSTVQAQNPVRPGEWTTVREYGHSYNVNDFTEDEYDWISSHYNLFTIEKRHAYLDYLDLGRATSEVASVATAAKLLANDSLMQPLFYWNIKVVYDEIYQTIQDALAIHPEWVGDNGWSYDDPACKAWMIDVLTQWGTESGHAGVFLDQVQAFQGPEEDIFEIMESTPGIVIYNGYTPRGTSDRPVIAATAEYLKYSDGVYIEHFLHGSHCKYLSQRKALMDSLLAAPKDKILIALCSEDTTYWNAPDHKLSLAGYLIIANENSYYHYVPRGLLASDNMKYWSEDFEKPLGPPLADATVNGYVYTRTFENAYVRLDLKNATSSINWIDNSVSAYEPIANLALLGTATQSSILHSGEASRANDGNTDGVFGNGSVTHTAGESQPWWIVDLGANYHIGEISVYNRAGESTLARLSNFTVYVLNEDSAVVDSTIYTTAPDPSVTTDAGGVEGRFVKVQLNGSGVLSLAEVTVAEVKQPVDLHEISINISDDASNDDITVASLMINDHIYTSNYVGKMILELPEGEYPYTLSKKNYYSSSNTLIVTKDTAIVLPMIEKPQYTFSCKVADDASSEYLSQVGFKVASYSLATDVLGEVSCTLYEGKYAYSLSKKGYVSVTDTLDLSKDTLVNIQMNKESYSMTFQVKNAAASESLQGASVAVNDSLYTTDAQGELTLVLDYGEYDYKVTKDGYDSDSSTIFLSQDSLVSVLLSLQTGMNSLTATAISIYPNPVNEVLIIDVAKTASANFEIYSIAGESVLSGKLSKGKNSIPVDALSTGIYFVKVLQDGVLTCTKMLK